MSEMNHRAVIEGLEELSDRSRQEELWLSDGSSGKASSFAEAIEHLFTDSGLGNALESGDAPYPPAALDMLNEIDKLAPEVRRAKGPRAIIDDAGMSRIRWLAVNVIELVRR